MAQKRPCDNEIIDKVSCKHARHMENSDRNASPLDVISSEDVPEKPYLSGGGDLVDNDFKGLKKPGNDTGGGNPEITENYDDARMSSSMSLLPWATSSTSEEDEARELVFHLPFSPDSFSFDHPVRQIHSDDLYCSLLDYPPRKLVPIGPEHQADIPELTNSSPIRDRNDELAGICIIPCSKSEDPSPSNSVEVGIGGTRNCDCPDMGYHMCVKQHIAEAREKLKATLGHEAFKELGFYDMGEVVAEKWREEDEQLFHKVVYSNPASLGKNFWNILSLVFPSRAHTEIVSYYFNVFILRKRAEQNRYDQMNIDSDNDELQMSDDDGYDDNDGGKTDEEDVSAVESPIHHHGGDDVHACCHHDADGLNEYVEDRFLESSPGCKATDIGSHKDLIEKGGQIPSPQVSEKQHYDDSGDNDVHDGSCTSTDSGPPARGPVEAKLDCSKDWHDFVLEPCDAKAWDGYSCRSMEGVDLLPTCSVIEEVFGDGSSFNLQSKSWSGAESVKPTSALKENSCTMTCYTWMLK